jgi:hypothetical protein
MEVKSLAFYDGGASEKRQTTAYDAATRCPFRVIRVVLHLGQPLPVRPYQRTSSDRSACLKGAMSGLRDFNDPGELAFNRQ